MLFNSSILQRNWTMMPCGSYHVNMCNLLTKGPVMLKLLDELLRTISGFEASNELHEEGLLKPPLPSLLPKPLKLLGGPIAPPASKAIESNIVTDSENKDGCSQWLLALEDVLPKVLPHSAAMVSFLSTKTNKHTFLSPVIDNSDEQKFTMLMFNLPESV